MSTNPRRKPGEQFTPHQIETAIEVMMESKSVKRWVQGQARFLNVDLNTPKGEEFRQREGRKEATRLVRG
jgi:hypothetical protein